LEIDWTSEKGWQAPKIGPVKNFSIDPRNSTIHYALECFEGLKGYPDVSGSKINFF